MCVDRRDFLRLSAGLAGAAMLEASSYGSVLDVPAPSGQLRSTTDGVTPISDDERRARIEKARRLMAENRLGAIFLESGSSLFYFTGVRLAASDRMFGLVIPARGELAWICAKTDEARARELIRFGKDIRTWETNQSPYKLAAQIFKDRGVS